MRRRKVISYILYILILLIIAFSILEFSFRKVYPEEVYNKDMNHYPFPYIVFAATPGGASCQTEKFNDLGFRGDIPTLPKENEYRIFFVGGSAAMAGCPLKNTISGKIEANLKSVGLTNAKVYNFGAGSFNSAQELSLLVHTLVDYRPDMVIIYDGANELQPYLYDPRPNYPYDFLLRQNSFLKLKNLKNLKLRQIFSIVLKKSRFISKVFGEKIEKDFFYTPELRKEVGYLSDDWKIKIISSYVNNILKMNVLSESYNFDFIAVYQPLVIYKEPLVGKEKSLYGTAEFFKDVYDSMATTLNNIEGRSGKNFFYDFRNVFDGYDKELYTDYVHVTIEGNEIIAGEITKIIISRLSS